jgi:hypothetical protein
MNDDLDLDALAANHVEGPQRRWPDQHSTCRACRQVWPCDASRLIDAVLVSETRFAVLESGATVLMRFTPGTIGEHRADRLKALLTARRSDIDWLVIEADEIVGFNPQPERSTDARCQDHHEEDADRPRQKGDQEGVEEGVEEDAWRFLS